jgi:hypothetical protein
MSVHVDKLEKVKDVEKMIATQTQTGQVSSTEGLVKRAKVNELARDYSRFAGGPLTKIVEMVYGKHTRVFISKHFPERLVDRNFAKREDRLFMFKLLSYVFEKRGDILLKDVDLFVKFDTFAVMIYSEFRDGIQQIRLNTFLPVGDDYWVKPKNGRPIHSIEVKTSDLMGYVPCTLKKPEMVQFG